MKYCKDCVGFDECKTTGRTVEFAVDDGVCIDFDERKPQTNADKIRSMTDEELAVLLSEPCECSVDPEEDGYRECGDKFCIEYLLNWLQQPVENPKEEREC